MKLPSLGKPKRTQRTVIDLTDAANGTLTVPLAVLRQAVKQTEEFGDLATVEFTVVGGFYFGGSDRPPALRSLLVEEDR